MESLVREIERQWLELVANPDRVSSKSESDLVDLQKLQSGYYEQLLNRVSNVVTENRRVKGAEGSNIVSSLVSRMLGDVRVEQDGDNFVLSSPIPILTRNRLDGLLSDLGNHSSAFSSNNSRAVSQRLTYYIFSGIYFLYKLNSYENDPMRGQDFLQFDLLRFQSDYSVYIGARDGVAGAISELERHRIAFDEQLKTNKNEINSAESKLKSFVNELGSQRKLYQDRFKESENIFEDIKRQLKDHKEEVINFNEVVKEKLSLNELGKLWDGVASRARFSTIASGLLILAMFIVGVIVAYYFGAKVVGFTLGYSNSNLFRFLLGDLSFGHVVARLLVITPPLILYFWLFKIAVRFFIRSLALYDDAIQRKTIMDTYLFLREMGKLDDNVMPLIIWSLCRQVPGHGAEGIEPPDFSEVINAGLRLRQTVPA